MPPTPTSPASVDDAALKDTGAGVKKAAQKKKLKSTGFKSQKAKQALKHMHAFFKAHRDCDEYRDMTFGEKQKVLGKLWKMSPENPKNNTSAS
ncbi:uncharacterized protein EKO05_0004798 [Ascochyta rabiei]|uniref:uncharacterized protein n=1 Tax=Didymella rabiei TaxID=5454 RepID=UPI00220BFCDA|nr:uncharacterized protein EKO05_0004798 [Ascochyta rabiei]UPX14310.1 hypothetical protein EKO05_0004798 [Ascochyta rabiei]